MKNYITYIIIFITLLLEAVLEKDFPILTLVFLLIITGFILVNVYLNEKYKTIHLLSNITHYLLVYVLIIFMTFVALFFLGYQTTPHIFIIVMLVLLFSASLGFVYFHIWNILRIIKAKK